MGTYLCRGPRTGWAGGTFKFRHPESGEMVDSPEVPALSPAEVEASKIKLVRGGQVEKAIASALDDVTRKPCGQALDELIAALPADGKLHQLECPKCGNPFTAGNEKAPEPVEEAP